jgi:hypothetical protein
VSAEAVLGVDKLRVILSSVLERKKKRVEKRRRERRERERVSKKRRQLLFSDRFLFFSPLSRRRPCLHTASGRLPRMHHRDLIDRLDTLEASLYRNEA